MNTLEQILMVKKREVEQLRPRANELHQQAAARGVTDRRDFAAALRGAAGMALIAEVKKASPSAGVIRSDFDPVGIARDYQSAGATALSVLTDQQFFQGNLGFLAQIRSAVQLPLLRKDFMIDEIQLYESAAAGADAILLIAAVLDDHQLQSYQQLAAELGLASLVEVHDEAELDRALRAEAALVGINNRNLKDFTVDLGTTERLCQHVRQVGGEERGLLMVAESGIHTRTDVARVEAAGARAILVGESLMRSNDISVKVAELMGPA